MSTGVVIGRQFSARSDVRPVRFFAERRRMPYRHPYFFHQRTLELVPILKRRLIDGFAALGAVWLSLAGCDSSKPNPSAITSSASTGSNGPPQMAGTPGVQDQGAPPIEETGPHAAGKKVFRSQHCAVCHPLPGMHPRPGIGGQAVFGTMAGPPGPGGRPPGGPAGPPGAPGGFDARPQRPPSLLKVGADPEHTVEWLMAQIRDPKSHSPESHMPAYNESKISTDDLKSLAEFLASLKGDEGGEQRDVESKSDGDSGVEIRRPGS
jgi:mono/diheme cytochrome c family protein